ncbi:MAG: outer membrane beta-barrel protein [Nitrospinota bacterium]
MKKLLLNIFLGLATILALSAGAQAQETQISGFVDMSYFSNNNDDTSTAAVEDTNTFGMDQAELDITHTVNEKASLRFDIESSSDTSLSIEQGYILVNAGAATLTFGKFNAPIGWELLDAPDMYQYSHSMVFDNGLPTNLTGVMVSGGSGIFDISVYFVNGWDKNGDDNKERTIGTRVGLTTSEALNIGLSYISGKEGPEDDPATGAIEKPLGLTVTDIDLTYTPTEQFTLGAEYNMGTHKESSTVTAGDDATWNGYLVTAHYNFNDTWGLTLRYDAFNDEDGERLGGGVGKEKRNALTIAPTFSIAEGLGGLIEFKTTKSDKKPYTDSSGNATDSETTLAAELTFSF